MINMRITLLLFMFLFSSTLAAKAEASLVDIGGWSITVPEGTEVRKEDGPDFVVTYFRLKDSDCSFGIYAGQFPRTLSKNQENVSKQKDKIDGQNVVWFIWKNKGEARVTMLAETFVKRSIGGLLSFISTQEKFHIFMQAPDEKSLAALQDIARTLKKNPPSSSTKTPDYSSWTPEDASIILLQTKNELKYVRNIRGTDKKEVEEFFNPVGNPIGKDDFFISFQIISNNSKIDDCNHYTMHVIPSDGGYKTTLRIEDSVYFDKSGKSGIKETTGEWYADDELCGKVLNYYLAHKSEIDGKKQKSGVAQQP